MTSEPPDQQKHKPSPKHTLEEVRRSLEDLVRNQLDDAPPSERAGDARPAGSATDANPGNRPREFISSSPRRKSPGLDTDQLLRSLNDLIGNELAEGAQDATRTVEGDTAAEDADDVITGSVSSPRSPVERSSEPRVTDEPVPEGTAETPGETEEITLEALPGDAQADRVLANELTEHTDMVEIADAQAASGDVGEPTTSEDHAAAPAASLEGAAWGDSEEGMAEPQTEPEAQTARRPVAPSHLSSPKVIEIPVTAGLLQAFAVRDPVLGEQAELASAPPEAGLAEIDAGGGAFTVTPRWTDELAREPTYSELGLLEDTTEAKASASHTHETEARSAASKLEDELTIDLESLSGEDTEDIAIDVEVDAGDAEPVPAQREGNRSASGRVKSADIDAIEIPGSDQLADDVTPAKSVESEPVASGDTSTEAQLTLDIATDDEPSVNEDEPNDAGDESMTPPMADTDEKGTRESPAEGVEAEQGPSRTAGKLALASVPERTKDFMKMPSVNFGDEGSTEGSDATSAAPEASVQDVELSSEEQAADQNSAREAPELTLDESGPLRASDAAANLSDAEFVELGDPNLEVAQNISEPGAKKSKLEAPSLELADSKGERASFEGSGMPWKPEGEQQDTSTAVPKEQRPSGRRKDSRRRRAAGVKSKTAERAQAPVAEGPARFGTPDSIPVLDEVVTAAQAGRAEGKPVAGRPSADKKAPSRRQKRTRDLAVQVIARLNIELRKCGERALSPAIIDRLQYLLRDALEHKASDVDNDRKKR